MASFDAESLAEESLKTIREEIARRAEIAKGRVNEVYSASVNKVESAYREAARRFAEKLS